MHKATLTAVSDGSRPWGQVSFSSLSEFYACSQMFRSSPIGLDSQCFLGASSRQELCAYFLLWFLCRGSPGRRSHLLEKEIWINVHDECLMVNFSFGLAISCENTSTRG
jgi:hypothetical protein